MMKRLLPLLLTLALLLCAAAGLGEQAPSLSAVRINILLKLAGENGAQWHEGTPPSPDMNAFQMWQWTDWFLANRVRSLLGTIQDYEQLEPDKPLNVRAESDQWQLRETENILSRFEAQLEEDRLAILNGISLCQSEETSESEYLTAYNRILEAESEIRQIIKTICRDYETYLAQVGDCCSGLQATYDNYTLEVHSNAFDSLAASARALEESENATNANFRISVNSTYQFRIQVLDPDKKPIKGATVTVTNQLSKNKKQTSTTDGEGNAVFWGGDLGADEKSTLQLTLRIEAKGYRTREVQTVKLGSGETKSVYLQKDDGNPYLIKGCFNGRDILTESHTYYCTSKNTLNHAFTVKLHCDKDGELELRYPVNANATEYKTVVKKFTAADSDKTVLKFEDQWLSKLPPGAKVSFTLKTGKNSYTTNTQLDIQKAMVDEPFFSKSALFSFTSGTTGIGFDIPGKIPFISGSRLAIDIPGKLPQVVYTPSYMVMFAWGYDFKPEQANWKSEDAEDQASAIKAFEARSKADKALAMAGTYRNINTTTTWKFLGNYGASVTPFVSAQGLYRTSDHSLELRGAGGATLAFTAEATQTFTVGPVPFFAGVDFSMSASFGMDITMAMKMDVVNGAPKVVKGPEIGYGSGLSVSLRLEMGLNGGIGLKKVASIGFRFYGYLNPIVHFTTPKVTADAKLGMGFTVTVRMLFLKWSTTLWKGELSLGENAATALNVPDAQALHLDFTGAQLPQPTAPNSIPGSEGLDPVFTEKLFAHLDVAADDLEFAQIGSQTYLFWIQPGPGNSQARLSWYNLSDLSINGEVSWLENGGQTVRRRTYMDYDFAVDAGGSSGSQQSSTCALTILSGKFAEAASGDEPALPSEACVATVLMQQRSDGALVMAGYQEGAAFDQNGNYPIMPEVCLSENGSDVSIVSSYSTSDNQQKIDGYIYHKGSSEVQPLSTALADRAVIARYCIGKASASSQAVAFYALNTEGELSRLTSSGNTCTREVLAQGGIINFLVLTGTGSSHSADRLFYLEQVMTEGGDPVQRLRSVTLDPALKRTDYDIETSASHFDIVRFDEGIYLYWTEYTTPDDSANAQGYKEEYLVRCVRYDPDTDTVFGPFSLVKLGERPSSIKLQNSGTGFYAVELENTAGSYQRYSLSRFTFELIYSAEMTAAVLLDPCVCAGDYTDLVFSVKNTGNVPISALDVTIMDTEANAQVQTLHIDLDDPEFSVSSYHSYSAEYTMKDENAMRRLSNMYDPLNHDNWEITHTTSAGDTVRSVHTPLLMPGDTHSYQTKIQIPADWRGGNTLIAQIVDVTGEPALNSRQTTEGLLLVGASQARSAAQNNPTVRLGSEATKKIDTDAHDLMLSAQLFKRSGEDYVHITIRNRSGNTSSAVTPVLTASFRGESLFSHEFVNSIGYEFGYTMDIPLNTLTKGRSLQELELHVSSKNDKGYEDFADSDNHVRLLLTVQLCIVDQPQSIPVSEGDEAVFSVTAAGGEKPYRYQWQRMTGVDRWENIPGADQDAYRIASVKSEQNGLTVRCVITDQFGDSATSDSAMLSILPQTGDRSHLTLWFLLALASAAALAMVCCKKRSR